MSAYHHREWLEISQLSDEEKKKRAKLPDLQFKPSSFLERQSRQASSPHSTDGSRFLQLNQSLHGISARASELYMRRLRKRQEKEQAE